MYDYSYSSSYASSSGVDMAFMLPFMLVVFALTVFSIVAQWKIFEKVGKPGWAAIVPVYNIWVLFEIVGYPGWWSLLTFVPLVNIVPAVMAIVAYFKLAKAFGKSDGFAVCNILFPIITLPILAFGKSQYNAPMTEATPNQPAPYEPVAPVSASAPTPESQPAVVTDTPQSYDSPVQPQVVDGSAPTGNQEEEQSPQPPQTPTQQPPLVQ